MFVPGGSPSLQRLKLECEEIKTLIPKASDDDSLSVGEAAEHSPDNSPIQRRRKMAQNAGLSLEDLDILPTKEYGPNPAAGLFFCIWNYMLNFEMYASY